MRMLVVSYIRQQVIIFVIIKW